jgi:hypothetical protein
VLAKLEKEGRADAILNKQRWLVAFAYPLLADRTVGEITAPELLAVLRKMEACGRYETARRLRSTCGTIFAMRSPPVEPNAIRLPICEAR